MDEEIQEGIYKIFNQSTDNNIINYVEENILHGYNYVKIYNLIDKHWEELVNKELFYFIEFIDLKNYNYSAKFNLNCKNENYTLYIHAIKDDYFVCLIRDNNGNIRNCHKVDYDKLVDYMIYLKDKLSIIISLNDKINKVKHVI